ncbi:hypothetical protein GIB67_011025 [Kingdonia uniflora]|uniref:Uncharacterized protein n=1 Tax=Kingdonia uniflora TaxID=39325 RepID=A0A7J7L6B5_9MAGN|nr:hypothetical protein GIB67_011025 [Kingdonia uniflora]
MLMDRYKFLNFPAGEQFNIGKCVMITWSSLKVEENFLDAKIYRENLKRTEEKSR